MGEFALSAMLLRRVVVAHGYTAHPQKHWFPRLKAQLEPLGIQVIVPPLPNTEAPVLEQWVDALTEAIGIPDEQTVVVGHSLGCVAALHRWGSCQVSGSWVRCC